jgi:hypothetical protein
VGQEAGGRLVPVLPGTPTTFRGSSALCPPVGVTDETSRRLSVKGLSGLVDGRESPLRIRYDA